MSSINSVGRPATRAWGYYLIGPRRSCGELAIPALFSGIAWGSEQVLGETLRIAAAVGFSVLLLDVLEDVDRPEDLPIWEREVAESDPSPSRW